MFVECCGRATIVAQRQPLERARAGFGLAGGLARTTSLSSPGSTGRPGIPETPAIDPRSRGASFSPPPTRSCALRGGVGGGGASANSIVVSTRRHPPPPTPPRRALRGWEGRRHTSAISPRDAPEVLLKFSTHPHKRAQGM